MTPHDEAAARAEVERIIPHQECEDRFYSCPLSSEGCTDERYAKGGCNCPAERQHADIMRLIGDIADGREKLIGDLREALKDARYILSKSSHSSYCNAEETDCGCCCGLSQACVTADAALSATVPDAQNPV